MEQNQLVTVAQQSGLEPARAELYAASFAPYMNEVVTLMQEAKKVNRVNPTPQDSAQARKIRLALVPQRTGAEKEKDKQKAALLKETNLIQALYNTVKSTAELTEAEMLEVEKHQERIEAERKAKIKAKREELLSPYCNPSMFPLADMEEDAFEQLLSGQKLAYEARIEAERKTEEARIEAARLEAERIEQQRIENERLKKEAEEIEAQLKKEREEAAAKQAAIEEAARKQKEDADRKQREIEEKARKEREALQAKLDAERKAAKAAKAEIERKEREQKEAAERAERERIAAEKKAAAAPDKEKLQLFKLELQSLKVPQLKTKEAAQIAENIQTLLDKVASYIDEKCASI